MPPATGGYTSGRRSCAPRRHGTAADSDIKRSAAGYLISTDIGATGCPSDHPAPRPTVAEDAGEAGGKVPCGLATNKVRGPQANEGASQ
jgi:hypothetical protein